MRIEVRASIVALVILSLAVTLSLHAQNAVQTISLRPGWNAIWVEVEPTNNAIGAVFTNLPVEVVWTYFEKGSTADFIQNANELPWNNPSWRRWFPPDNPKAVLNNLYTLNVNRAYLVKATNAASLTLTGRPSLRPKKWVPDSYNLQGFPIDPERPPTFDDFFAPAAAHVGQPIYRLNASGLWEIVAGYTFDPDGYPIVIPGTGLMNSGEAYWVYCYGASDYTAPLSVKLEGGDGLDYAQALNEYQIQFENLSSNVSGVFFDAPDLLPLSYYDATAAAGQNWVSFTSAYKQVLPAGGTSNLRLAIRRNAFAGQRYETLLSIIDGAGTRYLCPVSADNPAAAAVVSGGGMFPMDEPSANEPDHTGLWVGNAIINAVSEAHAFKTTMATADGNTTNQARAVFSFPGSDNDFEIVALQAGTDGNGLHIFLKSDGTAAGGQALASYNPAQRNLTLDIDRGATTAQSLITAVNAVGTGGFNMLYEAQPANGEGLDGILAETSATRVAGGGSEFNLRLLLHVDTNGTARLLKEVIQLWRDGSYVINPTSGLQEVDTNNPGRFVLITDDSRIVDFKGAALRDGEPMGRRISSAGIDFPDEPGQPRSTRLLHGTFALDGRLTNQFTLGYDSPTNPFKHRRHPDHDNKASDFTTAKQEAPDITRTIELQFLPDKPAGLSVPDYGNNVIAGTYREVLRGLHQRDLVVSGTFQLNRVSAIGELNPPKSNP